MGRPLSKKYFGNRNVGTNGLEINGVLSNSQNYADDRIGGEGLASINITNAGNWLAVTSGQVPISGLSLPAPTIPGGVQATWTVTYSIVAVTTGAGKTGLIAGETYTSAAFPGSIITVDSVGGSNATFIVTNEGATTTLPTDLQGVSITLRTGQGHTGAGTFLVDIFTKIKTIVIGEKGSGYTGNETITVVTANSATGTAPAMSIVLTTDSGNFTNGVANSDNQENAIIIRANTSGSGSTGKVGDIIKQVSTRRYKVKTEDGIGIVQLSTDSTPATGYAYLVATATGGTYYVTKLTKNRATLVAKTGDEALDGKSVQWRFSNPTATIVTIENA